MDKVDLQSLADEVITCSRCSKEDIVKVREYFVENANKEDYKFDEEFSRTDEYIICYYYNSWLYENYELCILTFIYPKEGIKVGWYKNGVEVNLSDYFTPIKLCDIIGMVKRNDSDTMSKLREFVVISKCLKDGSIKLSDV